jgi:hypothetical protein
MYETVIKIQSDKMALLVEKEDTKLYLQRRVDWVLRMLFVVQSLDYCTQHPGFSYILKYEHLDEKVMKFFKLA